MAFDSEKANIADQISLISELEHLQRHLLRSAVSPNIDDEERIWYAVNAKRAKDIRRAYMKKHFADMPDELWCAGKCTAAIRQLNYETFTGDIDELKEIDALVDSVWSKITGQDMTGCKACSDDKNA